MRVCRWIEVDPSLLAPGSVYGEDAEITIRGGHAWINIDGRCALRIVATKAVRIVG